VREPPLRPSGSRTKFLEAAPASFLGGGWGREHERMRLRMAASITGPAQAVGVRPEAAAPLGKRSSGPTAAPMPSPPPSTGGDERPWLWAPLAAGLWPGDPGQQLGAGSAWLPAAGQAGIPAQGGGSPFCRRERFPMWCWPNSASRHGGSWSLVPRHRRCPLIVHSAGPMLLKRYLASG